MLLEVIYEQMSLDAEFTFNICFLKINFFNHFQYDIVFIKFLVIINYPLHFLKIH